MLLEVLVWMVGRLDMVVIEVAEIVIVEIEVLELGFRIVDCIYNCTS